MLYTLWLKMEGKKTYLCAFLVGTVVVLEMLSVVDTETAATLVGLLGAGGLASLRAAK